MDDLPGGWLCELEMDVPFLIHQCQMSPENHSFDELDFESLSPETFQSSPNTVSSPTETCLQTIGNQSSTQLLLINNNKSISSNTSCTPENITPNEILLLEHPDSPSNHSSENYLNYIGNGSDDNLSDSLESCKKYNKNQSKCVNVQSLSRPPLQAKNHVVAERIRREKLNQKLIALSALVPGLKKMDKASILGDATKYIKQLEERIQTLEGDVAKKKIVKPTTTLSTFSLKRSRLSSTDDDTFSSNAIAFDINSDQTSPDVEIRVSDKHILVRIHCHKQDGVVPKMLNVLERFRLSVTSSSVLPFGDTALEITIIAQMGDECSMKVKDLVKKLRLAVLKFM